MSSLNGTDTATSRRRYRRDDRERREADEIVAEKRAEAGAPPATAPLDPPNPAFAVGREPNEPTEVSLCFQAIFTRFPASATPPSSFRNTKVIK